MAEETTLQVQETEKQEMEQTEAERTREGVTFVPRADIYETGEAVFILCDMPGVGQDSVNITLDDNILTIEGYVDFEPPAEHQLAYAEYRVGDFQRRFAVSNEIDANEIEATLRNGVLHIRLPKVRPASRKIEVKAS